MSSALPTSQLVLQPFRFFYVTSSSLTSPGDAPMSNMAYYVLYTLKIESLQTFNSIDILVFAILVLLIYFIYANFKMFQVIRFSSKTIFCRNFVQKIEEIYNLLFLKVQAASWRKRLGARLPPLGSRVRGSVTPCGFRGGRNGVQVGFSRGFSRFPLLQISFHHFSTLISSISFHFISPCDGASGVVGRHLCYSLTYTLSASSHLIPRPNLVLDTS